MLKLKSVCCINGFLLVLLITFGTPIAKLYNSRLTTFIHFYSKKNIINYSFIIIIPLYLCVARSCLEHVLAKEIIVKIILEYLNYILNTYKKLFIF